MDQKTFPHDVLTGLLQIAEFLLQFDEQLGGLNRELHLLVVKPVQDEVTIPTAMAFPRNKRQQGDVCSARKRRKGEGAHEKREEKEEEMRGGGRKRRSPDCELMVAERWK